MLSAPWGLRGKNLTLVRGRGVEAPPPRSQFSFPPSGSGHFPASHSRPIPKTQEVGWGQKERVGSSFVWLVFIMG